MTAEFPNRKTAVLVIHGIGEQNPLETLDSFSRGFINQFNEQAISIKISHQIIEQQGASGTCWTESFVRLQPEQGEGLLDIHEYYWAYLTEEKISVPEVCAWVEQTLAGTRRFYEENEKLRLRYEKGGKTSFRLTKVYYLIYLLSVLYPLLKISVPVLLYLFRLPLLAKFKNAPNFLQRLLRPLIVGYIGDVTIYTTTDVKSRFYDIRAKILAESLSFVESLLQDATYDRVIIAGHSLGSVIAYDTLNRLNVAANLPDARPLPLEKVGGLITFGSPLDKIAFFFREHAGKKEYVRRQIMQHLHSFKAKNLDAEPDVVELSDSITSKLDGIKWVNYYDLLDPVSGHLDFYAIENDDNCELNMSAKWGVAHTAYWEHQAMYRDILNRIL